MTVPELPEVRVDARELAGLLQDVERTASRDQLLPWLDGIVLHEDYGRLYATSTNRFLLGQGWVQAEGTGLETVYIDADGVTTARALLGRCPRGAKATLMNLTDTGIDGRPSRTLALHVPDLGHVVIPGRDLDLFPDMAQIMTREVDDKNPWTALGARFVAALAAIGKRRGQPLGFHTGEGQRPTAIHIGPGYRALLMPVMPGEPEEFRWSPPPRNT